MGGVGLTFVGSRGLGTVVDCGGSIVDEDLLRGGGGLMPA